jgi:hypothetical protein
MSMSEKDIRARHTAGSLENGIKDSTRKTQAAPGSGLRVDYLFEWLAATVLPVKPAVKVFMALGAIPMAPVRVSVPVS